MLVGVPPYYHNDEKVLYENIKHGILYFPESADYLQADQPVRDLILKLLIRNPSKRLGALEDAEEVKAHPFFKDTKWAEIA